MLHPQPAHKSIGHRGPHPGRELEAHADDAKEEEALQKKRRKQRGRQWQQWHAQAQACSVFTAVTLLLMGECKAALLGWTPAVPRAPAHQDGDGGSHAVHLQAYSKERST